MTDSATFYCYHRRHTMRIEMLSKSRKKQAHHRAYMVHDWRISCGMMRASRIMKIETFESHSRSHPLAISQPNGCWAIHRFFLVGRRDMAFFCLYHPGVHSVTTFNSWNLKVFSAVFRLGTGPKPLQWTERKGRAKVQLMCLATARCLQLLVVT